MESRLQSAGELTQEEGLQVNKERYKKARQS